MWTTSHARRRLHNNCYKHDDGVAHRERIADVDHQAGDDLCPCDNGANNGGLDEVHHD